ncbi:7-deoxyloganetic acid glucosyltransferase-like [Cucumis melo var. makuwa]|uniref:7-deoxyloganetic acid glucosyltransferase-like n=1 Tax=Cucumis melo var. makuwa TaxID=1194695 RepID=A0A5A7U3M9_CUCMM|nr:7-deoxyloganetic acid glucosyltransferase-like [Cucumis melo var. makuwa]
MSLTETLTVISDGNIEDPLTFKKAMEDVDKDEWIKSMNLELESIRIHNSRSRAKVCKLNRSIYGFKPASRSMKLLAQSHINKEKLKHKAGVSEYGRIRVSLRPEIEGSGEENGCETSLEEI